ncbi:MAG: hypothetical protein IJ622_01645 [Bacteroidales bacterium]|nr:hypothetical protein [Bacteroidales bacterium]
MESDVFLIKWYGPFGSQEMVKEWEDKHNSIRCSLYLLHGKLKYAKTKEKYYCGMSIRNIYKRLGDKGHHIEEIKDRLNSIYVGSLSNIKRPLRQQILLAEKIITANLTDIVGKSSVLNATNTYFPSEDVFVINEWWKTTCESVWERQPKNAPSNIIPDVLAYHFKGKDDFELFGCKKLKRLW